MRCRYGTSRVCLVSFCTCFSATPLVEDPETVFKQLLRESGISKSHQWEQAVKVLANDPRYNVVKKMSEKRRVCCMTRMREYD